MIKHFKEMIEANKLKTLTIYLSNGKTFELDTFSNKLKMNDDCLEFIYESELYVVNTKHIVYYTEIN